MRQSNFNASIGFTLLCLLMQPAFSQEPIKIGVMFPLTGAIASQGAPERDAIKQAFDEEKYTVDGRKIELLFEDDASLPDTGLTKIKALVERDKVDLLIAGLSSSVCAAMVPYIAEQKVPWVTTCALTSLTRAQKSPYIFRYVPSSYQYAEVAADWAKKAAGRKPTSLAGTPLSAMI